jgi:hypothetical protein
MKDEKLIPTASTAIVEAPRIDFTVTSNLVKQLDPGSQELRDNHLYVRGLKSVYKTCWTFRADGELVCHDEVVVTNVILSTQDMTGPMWGTFEYLDDEGAIIWRGIFHGNRKLVGGDMTSTIYDIGHGLGPNEGLLFQYTIQAVNITDPSVSVPHVGSGYVQAIARYKP